MRRLRSAGSAGSGGKSMMRRIEPFFRRQDAFVLHDAVRRKDRRRSGLGAPDVHRAVARPLGDGADRRCRRVFGDARAAVGVVGRHDAADGGKRVAHRAPGFRQRTNLMPDSGKGFRLNSRDQDWIAQARELTPLLDAAAPRIEKRRMRSRPTSWTRCTRRRCSACCCRARSTARSWTWRLSSRWSARSPRATPARPGAWYRTPAARCRRRIWRRTPRGKSSAIPARWWPGAFRPRRAARFRRRAAGRSTAPGASAAATGIRPGWAAIASWRAPRDSRPRGPCCFRVRRRL